MLMLCIIHIAQQTSQPLWKRHEEPGSINDVAVVQGPRCRRAVRSDAMARSSDLQRSILNHEPDLARAAHHHLQLEVDVDGAGWRHYTPVLAAKGGGSRRAAGATGASGFPPPDTLWIGGVDRHAEPRVADAENVDGRCGDDVARERPAADEGQAGD